MERNDLPREITDDRPLTEQMFGELLEGWRALMQLVRKALFPALMIFAALWAYDRYRAPKIMVVDVLAFDAAQKKALMNGKIDEQTALGRVETVKATLESYPDNVVFLRADMVIENGHELEFDFEK